MVLAIVVGAVVSSRRAVGMEGASFRLVDRCDSSGRRKGEYLVALDLLGSGPGEMVMLAQGSSCRWTKQTEEKPVDTLIVGIVEQIDCENRLRYDGGRPL